MSRPSAFQLNLHWLTLCTLWEWEVQQLFQLPLPSNHKVKVCRHPVTVTPCKTALVALIFYHLFFRWTHLFLLLAHQRHDSSILSHSQKKKAKQTARPPPTSTKSDVSLWSPTLTVTDFQPRSFSLWRHSDLEDKTLMLAVIPHNWFQTGEPDWMTNQWRTSQTWLIDGCFPRWILCLFSDTVCIVAPFGGFT